MLNSGVFMVKIEQNSNIRNRKLIFSLNYLYSGLHGQIKCLLQFVNHYFKLKKLNQDENARAILRFIAVKINQIIAIKDLVEELGGEIEILSYISNTYQYHADIRIVNNEDALFLEQISSEIMFVKECEKILSKFNCDKVKEFLTSFINQSEKIIEEINGLKKKKIAFYLV